MKIKRMFAIMFAFLLCLNIPAYAADASPSDASRSDALKTGAVNWFSLDNHLSVDDVRSTSWPTVVNTVNYSTIYAVLNYYNSRDEAKSITCSIDSSGYFSIPKNSDVASIRGVTFYFQKYNNALPDPGNYRFSVRFSSNTGVSYGQFRMLSAKGSYQASEVASDMRLYPSISSGDYYFSETVTVQ